MSDNPSETVKTGISMQRRHLDKFDERARELDKRRSHRVSRSETIVECALVGLQANKILDDKFSYFPDLRERQGLTRSAVATYDDADGDREATLVTALADEAGVDAEDLQTAVRRLQVE